MLEAPTFWVDNGDVGSSYYSVKELSWSKTSITSGEDEHGEYIDFDWTGCEYGWGEDALTFYFDNIQLNAGDKVYIRCSAYKGRWTQVYINETSRQPNIVCADVTGGELYQEKLCFTASETFELTSLSIRPEAWAKYDVHFRIYGVYIVRAE
ncbi:MAG: hypothetical protein IIX02_03595, partial [Clostridia bacterium]|nr:hypothetical protein [Clostridia bacterium]